SLKLHSRANTPLNVRKSLNVDFLNPLSVRREKGGAQNVLVTRATAQTLQIDRLPGAKPLVGSLLASSDPKAHLITDPEIRRCRTYQAPSRWRSLAPFRQALPKKESSAMTADTGRLAAEKARPV